MTVLTMRLIKGDFIVTGPDIEPMKFKSRSEARDWCKAHHPGSPITEIGPAASAGSQETARATEPVKRGALGATGFGRARALERVRRISHQRPALGLDRSDSEIDIGYRCVTARRGVVLIGQSDLNDTGRSKHRRNDLAGNALVLGAHSHHSDEVHFECKIFHGGATSQHRSRPT